jgi:transposase
MKLLYERCCGLDVHKDTVVACLRVAAGGKVTTEVRTFKATTAALLQLSAWLAANNCTHVAMEATGVYLYELSQPFYGAFFVFTHQTTSPKGITRG